MRFEQRERLERSITALKGYQIDVARLKDIYPAD